MKRIIALILLLLALLGGLTYAAQYSLVVPNETSHDGHEGGYWVRQDINNALNTLATLFSGPGDPATIYAYQLKANTATGYLQQRNPSNNLWYDVRLLDTRVPTATYASSTYSVTYDPAVTEYKDGVIYKFRSLYDHGTVVSFKANGCAAKYVTMPDGRDLAANTLCGIVTLIWDAAADVFVCLDLARYPDEGSCVVAQNVSANTNGGTFTSGAWQTRILNTFSVAKGGWSIIPASNQLTLTSGSWRFQISAPAYQVDNHQAILYNVTDGAVALVGTSEFSPLGGGSTTRSVISGRVTITGTKVFEVRHRCATTRAVDGFGKAANLGQNEIYTQVEIWKE